MLLYLPLSYSAQVLHLRTEKLRVPVEYGVRLVQVRVHASDSEYSVCVARHGRYTMVSGTIPFTGETIYVVYAMIERCEYTVPSWFDADLADLIRGTSCVLCFALRCSMSCRCCCSVALAAPGADALLLLLLLLPEPQLGRG